MNKKLVRLKDDRKLNGVCSGIAVYLGIDPTIVRLLWAVITIFTGFVPGIVLYIACIFIIPEESGYIEGTFREKND